jgi:beta-RFAP synthase
MSAHEELGARRGALQRARREGTVMVEACSRLHFGLLAPCRDSARRFGGVGAMVQRPALRVRVRRARQEGEAFSASGPLAARAQQTVERFCAGGWPAEIAPPAVDVLCAPCDHTGLGTGTQLALAVAAGLRTYAGLHGLGPADLARRAGRGERSAIGVHGFFVGGLLVDAGKRDPAALAPLVARVSLPECWRFVLITPQGERGLWGADERAAFEQLGEDSAGRAERLCRLVLLGILPAAAEGDFAAFSDGLYEFGREAGRWFASVQGGAFATPGVAARVEHLRTLGVRGAGQSSWGPTVFALTDSEERARWLVAKLTEDGSAAGCQLVVAPPANQGARILIPGSHGV